MLVLKKYIPLFLTIIMLFLFNSCNVDNDIVNYEEYEKNSIFEITISNPSESYYFICTDDYKIVTCDNIREKTKIADCKGFSKEFLNSCLESILEDGTNVESEFSVSDYYFVGLHIDDKDYYFTYGLSSNPYANMLVEMIIGSSDYKEAQESLVPFPATFREHQS